MNSLPIVAIVGPANAGKSTLLNKIVGRPLAVTANMPGTTRDRQYADVFWNQKGFTLVDTAGLILDENTELETNVKKQIEVALAEADAIILVVDGKQPVGGLPQQVLKKFRKLKTPKILAINKIDSQKQIQLKEVEFSRLGIHPALAVSALTGRGIGDLLDEVVKVLPKQEPEIASLEEKPEQIKICIVGKPNVGKSSLFNKILRNERAVVSPIPGTTRTAIDSEVVLDGEVYTFIDTAGLKKKEFRQTDADVFSGFQTFKSIRRSDICLFIMDASEEITKQDQRVANEIFSMDKGCIILANKTDLLSKPVKDKSSKGLNQNKRSADDEYGSFRDLISHHFPFLWMSPLFFVSAETGEGLNEALESIKPIYQARHKTVEQKTLDNFLQKQLKINPPKLLRDQKQPKVFGLTQTAINPATFELYVNHPAAISIQFRKFLENGIIRNLGFWGTPIKLKLRGKDKK